jgi:hypothetical protein
VCAVTQRTLELPFDSDLKKNFAIDFACDESIFLSRVGEYFYCRFIGGRYVWDRWRRGNSL